MKIDNHKRACEIYHQIEKIKDNLEQIEGAKTKLQHIPSDGKVKAVLSRGEAIDNKPVLVYLETSSMLGFLNSEIAGNKEVLRHLISEYEGLE